MARLSEVLTEESRRVLKRARRAVMSEEKPRAPEVRVYLASRFIDRDRLVAVQEELKKVGIQVTSRWIGCGPAETDKQKRIFALMDLEDIRAADVVVAFNLEEFTGKGRGGRHVELGYALGFGKPVILMGTRENVFHWHPRVRHYPVDFPLEQAIKETYLLSNGKQK